MDSLLISELTKEKKLKNLFIATDEQHLQEMLSEHYGFDKGFLSEISLYDAFQEDRLNLRGHFKVILPTEVFEEFDSSIKNGGRFKLYKISGTAVFVNHVNGSKIENKAEHIILVERLYVGEYKAEVVEENVTKLDVF